MIFVLLQGGEFLIYLFFILQLRRSKNREEEKLKRKSNDEIKNELLKSVIDGKIVENVDLNLSSDNVRNCEEEIPLVKEYETTIL